MGFAAGVGFIVDTNGDGTSDGKAVTLKKGSNITMSLSGSTLTINSTGGGGGSGSMTTVQSAGSQVGGADIVTLNFGSEFGVSETSDTLIAITIDDATTSAKGKASFSSDNFSVSSGAVTIKSGGVDLTDEVTGTLPVANGGTGATSLNDLITLTTHTTGNYVASVATSTGLSGGASGSEGATLTIGLDLKDEDNMSSNSASHAASQQSIKAYVDSVASGLDVKDSVRIATTANITLANQQTIDGVSVVAGNRVLVKDQSTGSQNGIYLCVDGGSWTRATDMAAGTGAAGVFVFVEEGTANADNGYVCTTNDDADTVGTNSLAFSQFSGAGQITAGDGLDKSGNTMSVDLKSNGGIVIESTEMAVDLGASSITGTLAVGDGGTGATSLNNLIALTTHTTGNYVTSITAGNLIDLQNGAAAEGGTPTIDVDLSEASAAVMAEADEFIFLDNDDSSAAKRESLSDLLDTIAGAAATTGLDRSGATLVVSDLHPVGVSGSANQLLTDDGDGTVSSEAKLTFDGTNLLTITDTTTSSSSQGGNIRLVSNDGALMASGHRLGVIEFAGAEDASNNITVGARIEAITEAAWSASENGASLVFYNTDGNASQSETARMTSDGYVGINDTAPISELSVSGKISITTEEGSTPSAPADGHGWLYTKSDGKIYWQSNDVAETDLTAGGGGLSGSGSAGRVGLFSGTSVIGGALFMTYSESVGDSKHLTIGAEDTECDPAINLSNDENTLQIGVAGATDDFVSGSADGDAIITSVGDHPLILAQNDTITMSLDTDNVVRMEYSLKLKERASAVSSTAGYGQLWVKNDGDGILYFTDDNGTDIQITTASAVNASGSGAFSRSGNIIGTNQTIGIGGSNAQELSLTNSESLNSEAIMAQNGTNASVVTKGMGMRKNVTIVVPDADTGDDTYTVAPTDHNIMICNVKPGDGAINASQIIRHVQLPAIGTSNVGREITITLHGVSGLATDNITVKPASDDVILYHGRMWDNNLAQGSSGSVDHSQAGGSYGGDGMVMGHAAATDVNWATLSYLSVVSVTMVAVDHTRFTALLGGSDISMPITTDVGVWATSSSQITADIWMITQVSGVSTGSGSAAMPRQQASLESGFEQIASTPIGG